MVNENIIIATVASAFPTIGVIGVAYFQYKSSQKADVKLNQIHDLTNSAATKQAEKIDSLYKEISSLKKVIKAQAKKIK